MNKTYITPDTLVISIETEGILASSLIEDIDSGDTGLQLEDGSDDPRSPLLDLF